MPSCSHANASAAAHTSYQGPAGLPGNSGHFEEVIPPSGTVAQQDDSAQWSSYVELPTIDEECEPTDMEQEDAPDPESTREKKMQSRLNTLFAKAVAVCGAPPTAGASSTPVLATSGFQLAEKKGKKNWAALPAVDEW